MDIERLKECIAAGAVTELKVAGIELKRSWTRDTGHDISALANTLNLQNRYAVIGVDDSGSLANHNEQWLEQEEKRVANHIFHYLSPQSALVRIENVVTRRDSYMI